MPWKNEIDELEKEEDSIKIKIQTFPSEKRKAIFDEYQRKIKDPDTYATLAYFLITGIHHFYLKKYFRGLLDLSGSLIGFFFLFIIPMIGVAIIITITFFELRSLFKSQVIVKKYNLSQLKALVEKNRVE